MTPNRFSYHRVKIARADESVDEHCVCCGSYLRRSVVFVRDSETQTVEPYGADCAVTKVTGMKPKQRLRMKQIQEMQQRILRRWGIRLEKAVALAQNGESLEIPTPEGFNPRGVVRTALEGRTAYTLYLYPSGNSGDELLRVCHEWIAKDAAERGEEIVESGVHPGSHQMYLFETRPVRGAP